MGNKDIVGMVDGYQEKRRNPRPDGKLLMKRHRLSD